MSSGQPQSSLHNYQGQMRLHTYTRMVVKHGRDARVLCLKPMQLLENSSCSAPGPVQTTAVMGGSCLFLVLREFNLSERGKKKQTIIITFLFTHCIRINGLRYKSVRLRLCLMLLRQQCECSEYRYGIISSSLFCCAWRERFVKTL